MNMAENNRRPVPTKAIIAALCGRDNYLLNSVHHVLCELPLSKFYPLLDLDELAAFAAGSWTIRDKHLRDMNSITRTSIYDLFSEVFKIGYPMLNKHKDISSLSGAQLTQYHRLNHYSGNNLEERLLNVDPEDYIELTQSFREPTKIYVFEGQYSSKKMELGGDNSNISIMRFQNVWPPGNASRIGQIKHDNQYAEMINKFAGEIARLISAYPRGYLALDTTKPGNVVYQPHLFALGPKKD
jgi:hypothetical protein